MPRKEREGGLWLDVGAGYLPSENNEVKKGDNGAGSCWWTVVADW